MAERETSDGGFLANFANSTSKAVRDVAARLIDTNASFARQVLDFQAQATNWAKDTPMGTILQSQYAFNQELIDAWQRLARAIFRVEEPQPEKMDGGL